MTSDMDRFLEVDMDTDDFRHMDGFRGMNMDTDDFRHGQVPCVRCRYYYY